MKKILCLFLVVLTILSNSFCAFAANTTVNSTIENPGIESQNAAGPLTDTFEQVVTAAPITITSLKTDLASPQRAGTKIRWTCTATGGTSLLYYYKIYKGSTVITQSSAYSTDNYFDWTPTEEGADYRALVYVKEAGSANSNSVTMFSDYYIIDNNTITKQINSITEWTIDTQNGYIYTVSQDPDESIMLHFIRLSDLEIEKSIVIGYYLPSDIDTADGKVYVALADATVVVVDVAEKAVEKVISPREMPYRIAVDGNKLFYTEEDQWCGLYVYDMANNSENNITTSSVSFEPDLAVDRENHILYAGESGSSGCHICAISTIDYSLLSQSIFDYGYGFSYPERSVVYDDGSVYYAGYSLDAVNLDVINGCYSDKIIYAKGDYVFSKNSVYDRDKYLKIEDLPFTESKILMDSAENIYLYDIPTGTLHKQHMYYALDTAMRHTNSLNNVILDEQLTSWVSSEDSRYIYAVSQSGNKLLFIRTSDLTVEKEMYVGSMPSDIELANGYLYIPLSGSTKLIVIDPATGKVSRTILLKKRPYRIAIDGDKLFYTEQDLWCEVYVYELSSGVENSLPFDYSAYEPDLAVDRTNHVLYVGASDSSDIYSCSTVDYKRLSKGNYDYGQGSVVSKRDVIFDNGSIYYAERRFEASNLTSILVKYNEHIIYAKDTYVFSRNLLFNKDSNKSVVLFDKSADLAVMLNDDSYLLYNDQARSINKKELFPSPVKIVSLEADKASPQLASTTIRWTCNVTGGIMPVYYFKVYKGTTLVKNSEAYSTANYFDWTPTEAGTDYRILVNAKENGTADSTSVAMYSGYYTITASIVITSILPDKASPQPAGTKIRWTTTVSGAKAPVYYYIIYKGSTVVTQSSDYSTNNYFDWTPTAAGTDYRALVYVKENGASYTTRLAQYSSYFTIAAPISISSLTPDKASPQPTGTKIRWTATVSGAKAPVYYYKIYEGSTVVTQSSDYSTNNYFDWTPTAAGTDYRALVYVKENGASYTTRVEKYSSYFTIAAPISISSLTPDKASPQPTGTKIRWTCTVSGGKAPVYYFKICKGSTVVTESSDYSTNNYFDWTPTEEGIDYQALVYVKEEGSANSTSVTMFSDYYIIDSNTMIKQINSITEWTIDTQNGYIYAVSQGPDESIMLHFIRLSDLEIEKSIVIGHYLPSDIDTADGKVYVALADATVVVVDVAEKAVEKVISPIKKPYRIAVDGNKLFYTEEDQWCGLYVYDMTNNSENNITTSSVSYEPDLAVDRENHILYAGEPGSSGDICAISTIDYSLLSQSTFDYGYGFSYIERSVVYDDGSVYYAGYSLDAGNLDIINGCYNDKIIYAKGDYIFSENSVYDRGKYLKIEDLPFTESKILMDSAENIYLYDIPTGTLHKQHIYYSLDTAMRHTNSLNNVILDEQLTSWVSNEDSSYIYAISQSGNKLLFIRTSDLTVEKEIYIGSMPSDIELANGYLYIPFSGSTEVIVIDPATGEVSKSILLERCPYRIAMDGDKLFYTEQYQLCGLYVYDMVSRAEERINSVDRYCAPDLAVDRINHILYVGESNSTGSNIYSFSTIDYSQISKSTYDNGYGFYCPDRNVIYDNGNIYYAGHRFKASNLASILYTYNEPIKYAKDTYVLTKRRIFDRDSNKQLVLFDKSADLAAMLNDDRYLSYNDQARSINKKELFPSPVKIVSIEADKASPQLVGTTIRWTCNVTGGVIPVYYFRVYKGTALVKNSAAYSTANYLDWTPTEAGTDYRILVNVKENGTADSTSVAMYSSYYTISAPAPIAITSILPDKASPQVIGTKIRWTTTISGGKAPVYYYKIYKGSTVVAQSSDYSTNNYFDWTPTAAGTDYKALVYVKENGASYTTRVEKYSGYYTITASAPIAITSILPDKASPQLTGTKIRWTTAVTGGKAPVYYYKIFKGSTIVSQSSDYSANNYFDWTPTAAGTDYRALVYVKENGASYTTRIEKYSSYYTVAAPIAISSLTPNKASPQPTGTKIRWTCNITGGKAPVYYFRIYKGSSVVAQSPDYSANNYFDWTPTAAGTDYRALVYVKENGASYTTRVEKYSSYYTVSTSAPIAITSIVPDKASPQSTGTKIRWTCNITGGKAPVYYFRIYKGSTVVAQSSDYATNNYFDWTPMAAGTDYRALVYVKENGASYTTRVEKYSSYYTVAAPIAITSIVPDKASPQSTGTKIRWTCNITGGKAPVYYFRIYKGSTLVTQSSDYSTNNYFDWTPTAAGTDYRALVYVKENGASYTTRVEKYSGYFTVTEPAPKVIETPIPDTTDPGLGAINIIDLPLVK